MNKWFLLLLLLMGVVVLFSNYLVQFPIKYYGLDEILTYGAFSYPIAFLITDLANRSYGKMIARKIVYLGFVIGVGGVDSGFSAYNKFLAGADYIQLYTGMVYKGPNIVNIIKNDLRKILTQEGVKNFTEIVGNKSKL